MSGVAAIIQARMGSRRLFGKVLEPVQGLSLLGHVILRTRAAVGASPVVVATATGADNDRVAQEALRHGAEVFRGAEDDVLERYYLCARALGADTVIRVCADCIVLDRGETEALLRRHAAGADHTHNKHGRGVVSGAGAEVIRMAALGRAHREATAASDREHVTPYLQEHPGRFVLAEVDAAPERRAPELDLAVDTAQDLADLRELAGRLATPLLEARLEDVIRVARTHGLLRKPLLEGARA